MLGAHTCLLSTHAAKHARVVGVSSRFGHIVLGFGCVDAVTHIAVTRHDLACLGAHGDPVHALWGSFHPAPEYFRHTPGLRDTPTRRERLLSIEDLADRTESCLIQLWDKTREQVPPSSPVLGVHPQPGIDK